jgi:hypothetical protein
MDGLEDEEEAGSCKDSGAKTVVGMLKGVKLLTLNTGCRLEGN